MYSRNADGGFAMSDKLGGDLVYRPEHGQLGVDDAAGSNQAAEVGRQSCVDVDLDLRHVEPVLFEGVLTLTRRSRRHAECASPAGSHSTSWVSV